MGHGLLAFALAAAAAHLAGWPRERALVVGAVAGGFALAPDVDMLYAPMGLLGTGGVFDAAAGFWTAGNQIHRAVTHSLVVGSVLAAAAGAWATRGRFGRLLAGLAVAGVVTVAAATSGVLAAGVLIVLGAAVLGLAAAGRRYGLAPRTVGLAAGLGLCSHPFGDLLTGTPPAFLYPLDATLVGARPAAFGDPTLNLLAPLYLELATMWLAIGVFLWIHDARLGDHLAGRASLGVGFAGAAVLLPAPTLEVSYHFVFPLLAVGAVLSTPLPGVEVRSLADLRDQPLRTATTGLAAVTLAALAYTVAYVGTGI